MHRHSRGMHLIFCAYARELSGFHRSGRWCRLHVGLKLTQIPQIGLSASRLALLLPGKQLPIDEWYYRSGWCFASDFALDSRIFGGRDAACRGHILIMIIMLDTSVLCGRGMPRPYQRAFSNSVAICTYKITKFFQDRIGLKKKAFVHLEIQKSLANR